MEAQVPLIDRLLTRIQTVESISLGMSAFQVTLKVNLAELMFSHSVRLGTDQRCPAQLNRQLLAPG